MNSQTKIDDCVECRKYFEMGNNICEICGYEAEPFLMIMIAEIKRRKEEVRIINTDTSNSKKNKKKI